MALRTPEAGLDNCEKAMVSRCRVWNVACVSVRIQIVASPNLNQLEKERIELKHEPLCRMCLSESVRRSGQMVHAMKAGFMQHFVFPALRSQFQESGKKTKHMVGEGERIWSRKP